MNRARPSTSLSQRVHRAFDRSEATTKALRSQHQKARRSAANLKHMLEHAREYQLSPSEQRAIRKAMLALDVVAGRKERAYRASLGSNAGSEVSVRQMTTTELETARAERGLT